MLGFYLLISKTERKLTLIAFSIFDITFWYQWLDLIDEGSVLEERLIVVVSSNLPHYKHRFRHDFLAFYTIKVVQV